MLIWVVRSPPAVLIEGFCFVLLLVAVNRREFKDTVADRLAALLCARDRFPTLHWRICLLE